MWKWGTPRKPRKRRRAPVHRTAPSDPVIEAYWDAREKYCALGNRLCQRLSPEERAEVLAEEAAAADAMDVARQKLRASTGVKETTR